MARTPHLWEREGRAPLGAQLPLCAIATAFLTDIQRDTRPRLTRPPSTSWQLTAQIQPQGKMSAP